jgi:hypothetical protein
VIEQNLLVINEVDEMLLRQDIVLNFPHLRQSTRLIHSLFVTLQHVKIINAQAQKSQFSVHNLKTFFLSMNNQLSQLFFSGFVTNKQVIVLLILSFVQDHHEETKIE